MVNGTHAARRRAPSLPRKGHGEGSVGVETPRTWQIAASDLVFLWEQCEACFYRKVVRRQPRPRGPFPMLFSQIDATMKHALVGERLEEFAPGAPSGTLTDPDRWLASLPLALPTTGSKVVLRGRADLLLAGDGDEDGIIDLKTASPRDSHVPLYGRQLHSYAWARERPARGPAAPASSLGLLCFGPDRFSVTAGGGSLAGTLRWVGVDRDDSWFEQFLIEVVRVLEKTEPPLPAHGCPWCRLSGFGLGA